MDAMEDQQESLASICSVQPTNVSPVPQLDQLKEHVASEKAYLVILITSTRYPYLQDFITGIT